MNSNTYIRGKLIELREKKVQNEKIGCMRVANRLQREIDRLEKQLVETEKKSRY